MIMSSLMTLIGPTWRGHTSCVISSSLWCCVVLLCMLIILPGAHSYCGRTEEEAYSGSLTYNYPRSFFSSWTDYPYGKNLNCEVLFKAYYDGDGVKLEFKKLDVEPPIYPGDYGSCRDKIVVYDGDSTLDTVLATLCGEKTTTVESKGRYLLLTFTTDSHETSDRGFSVVYSKIDRGGSDKRFSLGPGTLAAIIIPSVLFYGCLFYLVYRRCKVAQNIRRNLAATGHTPEDMQIAMATMMDQASRQPLTSTTANRGGRPRVGMNEILLEHMDASRDRRLGGAGGDPGARAHADRTRHPAGEHRGRASPYYAPALGLGDSASVRGSRRGSPAFHHPDGLAADLSHSHREFVEDDRRSHGSGRSGRSHGHRNPSPRPHSHRGDNPVEFTYYGHVDDEPTQRQDPATTATAPRYDDVVQPPPPSYEEAATGKYNPKL